MGQKNSRNNQLTESEVRSREVYVKYDSCRKLSGLFVDVTVYKFEIRYQRYRWYVWKRFQEIDSFNNGMTRAFPHVMGTMGQKRPPKHTFVFRRNEAFQTERAQKIELFLQEICNNRDLFLSKQGKLFFQISSESFLPHNGRKSLKEGYLKKTSGGFHAKFSRELWRYHIPGIGLCVCMLL